MSSQEELGSCGWAARGEWAKSEGMNSVLFQTPVEVASLPHLVIDQPALPPWQSASQGAFSRLVGENVT